MRKIVATALTLLCLCPALSGCNPPVQKDEAKKMSIVEENGFLSVKESKLVNQNGNPIVLKGVSLGWHNWWGRFFNQSCIKTLANDWNADIIRAAIGVEPDNAYLDNPQYALSCLYEVVDGAIQNGIYVIIDWHSHGIHQEEAIEFFEKVARKYNGTPNVLYEIFNEPVDDSWDDVKQYSEAVIAAIRAIDKQAIIIVGSPHWDQDIHLAADNPIEGCSNIMYSLHFYAGSHKQDLRDRANYALKKGLPLFVSECAGMNADGDGPIDMNEWNRWLEWTNRESLSWIAWAIADKNETCSMIMPNGSSSGPWPDSELKEWGIMVKKHLHQ